MDGQFRALVVLLSMGAVLAFGACSSSIGGGSSPPRSSTVVVPACADGSAPPCY